MKHTVEIEKSAAKKKEQKKKLFPNNDSNVVR